MNKASLEKAFERYQKQKIKLMNQLPAVQDLRRKAMQRLPAVSLAYLETGTDEEVSLDQNIVDLQKICYKPQFLRGDLSPRISTQLFGETYSAPYGMAPIGLTGLIWPHAEEILAYAAAKYEIPSSLSTVATQTPETVGPYTDGRAWFQLYTPRHEGHAHQLMDRAWQAGYKTLLVTVDIPTPSRRQRSKRAGVTMPPVITPHSSGKL